ncbi:unnamed protein product [Rhizophagus irregularis]|nr:unnamed protein product [Rhizophagus irregularis]CAB5358494.1 unnamed protein product [Rhizophagus irregularis]
METIYLPQQYISAPQVVAPHVNTIYSDVPTGNQIIDEPFYGITDESYYQRQFDDQQVVLQYPMLTPPMEHQTFIDLETYDMKPINISPEFEHPQIITVHPHPPSSELGDHLYIEHQEIERPDLKIMIPNNNHNNGEDVKPFIIKSQQSFPPSPPTSPPTPHASSTSNDKPKKITTINVEEDDDVKIVKQENEDAEKDQNELPTYVNPKQYERILKRRLARERFQKKYNISKERKPYIHQSRHNHAVRRLRGPGGRFLSATETAAVAAAGVAEMDRRQSLNSNSSSCVSPTTPVSSTNFFNIPYTYINSNDNFSTMTPEGYHIIENNETWNSTTELCKNENFPNMITSGNVFDYTTTNMYESYSQTAALQLQLQQTQTQTANSVIYLSTPITPITPINDNHIQYY